MRTALSPYGRSAGVVVVVLLTAIVAGCGGMASAPATDGGFAVAPQEPAYAEPALETMDEGRAFIASPTLDTRKFIATAFMELVVADTEETVDEITSLADEFRGYVSQANLYRGPYGEGSLLSGSLTLRIPAEQLEPFLARLEALALEVRSMHLDRQDVTDQYSDVEAQLRNLRATENELRELLGEVRARPNATSEDILAVHRDLTQVRGEIDQYQGRQNLLADQIALSTVEVTLMPDEASRPVVEEGWQPGAVLRDAMRALVNALQFFGDLAIWVVVFLLPILLLALIPLALLAWLIRMIAVRRRRKRQVSGSDPLDRE